jgi:hypothetical protein
LLQKTLQRGHRCSELQTARLPTWQASRPGKGCRQLGGEGSQLGKGRLHHGKGSRQPGKGGADVKDVEEAGNAREVREVHEEEVREVRDKVCDILIRRIILYTNISATRLRINNFKIMTIVQISNINMTKDTIA